MESVPEDTGDFLPQDLLRPEERQVLIGEQQIAVASRTTDALIRWYIAPAMIAANTTLLLFALPRLFTGEFVGLMISATSVLLVRLWYHLELRIYGLIEYWNRRLIAIAEALQPLVRVYGGEDWQRDVRGTTRTTHDILVTAIRIFGAVATIVTIVSTLFIVKPELRVLFQALTTGEIELKEEIEGLKLEVVQLNEDARQIKELKDRVELLGRQYDVLSRQLRAQSPGKSRKGKRP